MDLLISQGWNLSHAWIRRDPLENGSFSEARGIAPKGTAQVHFYILNVDGIPNVIAADTISAKRFAAPGMENPKVFFRLVNNGR
jgi:hypothetical protein